MEKSAGFERLTERQKEILRLLAVGHDVKSVAAELGISAYTVNDHLGEARRHLGAPNSRAAARLFVEHEGTPPKKQGPHGLGIAPIDDSGSETGPPGGWKRWRLIGGLILMLFTAALIGLLFQKASEPPASVSAAPVVVSTSPADASTIPSGPFDLVVRFDRPMKDNSYSFVQASPATFPDCPAKPRLSRDRMSYSMRCTAVAGRDYEIWFNRPPYLNFKSRDGVAAQPHRIRFTAR